MKKKNLWMLMLLAWTIMACDPDKGSTTDYKKLPTFYGTYEYTDAGKREEITLSAGTFSINEFGTNQTTADNYINITGINWEKTAAHPSYPDYPYVFKIIGVLQNRQGYDDFIENIITSTNTEIVFYFYFNKEDMLWSHITQKVGNDSTSNKNPVTNSTGKPRVYTQR